MLPTNMSIIYQSKWKKLYLKKLKNIHKCFLALLSWWNRFIKKPLPSLSNVLCWALTNTLLYRALLLITYHETLWIDTWVWCCESCNALTQYLYLPYISHPISKASVSRITRRQNKMGRAPTEVFFSYLKRLLKYSDNTKVHMYRITFRKTVAL